MDSDHADADLRGVAAHVGLQRQGFFDYLAVYGRGVEQMQSVGVPYGNAYVRCVEPGSVGLYGNDIAVVYRSAQQGCVA